MIQLWNMDTLCAAGHFRVVHFWVGLSDLKADRPIAGNWKIPVFNKNESIELLVSFEIDISCE